MEMKCKGCAKPIESTDCTFGILKCSSTPPDTVEKPYCRTCFIKYLEKKHTCSKYKEEEG